MANRVNLKFEQKATYKFSACETVIYFFNAF